MRRRLAFLLAGTLCLHACRGPNDGREAAPEPPVHDHDAAPPPPDPPSEMVEPEAPLTDLDPLEDPTYRRSLSRGGTYAVLWKPVGGDVPKNEHFELLVRVYRKDGQEHVPLEGLNLVFTGWMPDHGHGMNTRPQATDEGAGAYRVRGMLFHMGGHWQFFIDVVEGSHSERAEFDVLL